MYWYCMARLLMTLVYLKSIGLNKNKIKKNK